MESPAKQVVSIIEDNGLATFSSNLYVGRMPHKPDDCITVYNTGGLTPDEVGLSDTVTIQVRVRNNSYLSGYQKTEEIRNLFWQTESFLVNDTKLLFFIQSDIAHIGHDENDRPEFTINFRIKREVIN